MVGSGPGVRLGAGWLATGGSRVRGCVCGVVCLGHAVVECGVPVAGAEWGRSGSLLAGGPLKLTSEQEPLRLSGDAEQAMGVDELIQEACGIREVGRDGAGESQTFQGGQEMRRLRGECVSLAGPVAQRPRGGEAEAPGQM